MKHIARKWLAIAMAIALVFGCALAETETAAPKIDAEVLCREGLEAYGAGDYATALEKFTPAAEAGYAPAQYNLGVMYEHGEGVEQDYAQAVELYTKAAEQGAAAAQSSLGFMYEAGRGVDQDYEAAAEWYTKAAEQGFAGAQTHLGYLYFAGEGVEQDYAAATEWLTKAAEQEVSSAQYLLGVMYEAGAIEHDLEQARAWYQRAADNGNASAAEALEKLDSASTTNDSPDAWTDKEAIQGVQLVLNIFGYDCGTPDGVIGEKTRAAISQFQEDNGLVVTGTLNMQTLNALTAIASESASD